MSNIPEKDRSGFAQPVLSNPYCILDTKLKILEANMAFISFFDADSNSIIHHSITTIVHKDGEMVHVPRAAEQIVLGEIPYAEHHFSKKNSEGSYQKFRIRLDPVFNTKEGNPKNIQGVFVTIMDVTQCHFPEPGNNHQISLLNIIHEISSFNHTNNPHERLIQQLLSRIGPVIHPLFVSFIDIRIDGDEWRNPYEIVLWSNRYGFLIGEGWGKISDAERAEFDRVLHDLVHKNPISFVRDTAPEMLKQLMISREVTTILVIPAITQGSVSGILVLWSNDIVWSDTDVIALQTIMHIIGSYVARSRIEGELSRSEEKFKGVIEHIGDMYYLTDQSGAFLEISPSMISALGYQSDKEIIGKKMETLFQNQDLWPVFLSDILNENGVKDYELVLKGAESRVITGSVSCRLVYDEEGALRGIEGVIRDISRRRQYEQLVQESEWKYEQARKIAKLGVWSYDSASGSFRVSPEIFTILAIPKDKSRITLDDLIHLASPADKPKYSQYFESMVKAGSEFAFESRMHLADEKFRYIKINGQPRMRGGIVNGSFGILQDITDRKEVEQHLLRYANQLEQKTLEMDAMRTQLLDMNRELDQRVRKRTTQIEQLLRQKDEFIMQIGHDLKTPLTPLVAILPYVRKKVADPELEELLDVSIDDVKTIKKMITTILELAQMNALFTISDLQQINLYEALERIITDNAYLIHQKSLQVTNLVSDTISLKISPMHLETLVGNLIGNAVKYSYIDGKIILSASDSPDSVTLKVQDNGIGIAPDILPRIFDEFYKADSSRHDRESHGLGLAIAQRIADIYGGTIRAFSEGEGKGSTFSVKLKKEPHFVENFQQEKNNEDIIETNS